MLDCWDHTHGHDYIAFYREHGVIDQVLACIIGIIGMVYKSMTAQVLRAFKMTWLFVLHAHDLYRLLTNIPYYADTIKTLSIHYQYSAMALWCPKHELVVVANSQ